MARYALIGSPVSHSLSPLLMKRLGIPYKALEIKPEELSAFMAEKAFVFSGLNITTPLKEQVIPFMATLSSDAQEINGVNCAVNRGASWEGHNTDLAGILFALDYLGIVATKALILGTGPAARAAAFALRSRETDFLFLSRLPGPGRITWDGLDARAFEDHDLIINASPPGTLPLLSEFLGPHNFVLDMNYGERAFDVSETGAGFSNGVPVLLGQAAASLVLWMGRKFADWAMNLVSVAREIGIL